jgi:hypothetical protein
MSPPSESTAPQRETFDLVAALHASRSEASKRRISMQAWARSAQRLIDAPQTSPTQVEAWRVQVLMLLADVVGGE